MKNKRTTIFIVFVIIMLAYIAVSFLNTINRNFVFWIGLAFALLSILICGFISVFSFKKTSAFPMEISLVSFSFIYMIAVIGINIIFGNLLFSTPTTFVSIHILTLCMFAVFTILIYIAKSHVINQNRNANGKLYELQILIYDLEKTKYKLYDLPEIIRNSAISMFNNIIDELKFSNFSHNIDVADLENNIRLKTISLSLEIDNMIEIQSDNLNSFEAYIFELHQLIKERDMQIKLLSNNI